MLRKSCLMVVIIETTMMRPLQNATFAEAGEFETAIEGMKLGAYDIRKKNLLYPVRLFPAQLSCL